MSSALLTQKDMHNYQNVTVKHITNNNAAGIFLGLGLGKTVSTLTAIDILLNQYFEISNILIIAPKRVAESVWQQEALKWEHLKHLSFSLILGSEKERKAALKSKADIHIINRENVPWLVAQFGTNFPYDCLVIDELSSFKSAKSSRFKALRQVRPRVNRVIGLTGTPSPNGLLDLWSQLYLLDMGQRLGKTITQYRDNYFTPGKRSGHVVFDYKVRKDETGVLGDGIWEKEIYGKIGDICISMKAEDYLDMPKRVDVTTEVTLSDENMERYLKFEKEQVLLLADVDGEISAPNAAALTGKLLQFANGAIYDADKNWHVVHDEKLDALEERIEAANGEPVLVFYSFKHDLARIEKRFKAYKPVLIKGAGDIVDWNAGKIKILLAHPASAGHGLNLQQGGHLMEWFSLPWSLELYEQGVGREDRQGQRFPVINNRILTRGTMDEKVLLALGRKATGQDSLMNAVKAIISKYI